ncbi:eukaryotic translation initiation factor 3 subunit E [Exophiala xenobiotica]|uniref:Eukaryotic translation initiation factor 3 subunit E n=1 Tax=Vermiconidia calcicola TaxID=1690605 RepID=A0AAV9Q5I8_9PEZI|nr:eukaryotic translation initiation factor 3 subunit E [Exophiala xenobiotica]KAK5533409.1 eukaryotic translation initiation factor 3 subunit E [Vermiconidia calcicola]KAK5542871.1 eukaryotic translation initiation factor 3 subunit E [Chaetothyriales sp. CCFEE 6169]KAK5296398.1 eukaryotic translation initiation factor 3 subunit E [Exophiala xenobiotica]KAK5334451.1 eukaryotic translation initiation factor 3 subunit E [Exophiala xenobiotica]
MSTVDDATGEYAFLSNMIQHLDRHLIFPLLEHQLNSEDISQQRYDDLKLAIFNLLKNTNMIDYVGSLYKEIHNSDTIPSQYAQKREEVLQKLAKFEEESTHLTNLLSDEAVTSQLRSDKVANLKFLEETHGVTQEMVDNLYDFGRFRYECGLYPEAADLLYRFRVLSTDNDKVVKATWGKLVCEILGEEWESALEEVEKVKEHIETRLFNNPRAQLTARESLVHYALFPFFNYEPAREKLTEMFFSPPYLSTIQTVCPWILRYLAAAVITNRGRTNNSHNYQKQLKDLVRVVKQEIYEYQDPVTEFVKALYVDFDFEGAQKKLTEAEAILRGDFFLGSSTDAFMESARHLISESYCKIHQRIDITDLSTRLGLSQNEGEKWIVNLIRDTRVDAKIDYQAGTVVMNHPPQSVYQQVIEKTKGAFFRTQVLSAAVAK